MLYSAPPLPGYRLNEYLLVLSPNEELRHRIRAVKQRFYDSYGAAMAIHSKPHLTLVKFFTWNRLEERLVNRFRHIAMGQMPFKIELKDFGSYPSHTIYINVTTKLPVQELVNKLKSAQRLMKADPDHTPHFMSDPHFTIARKLLPWQFEKGWLEYSHRHFSAKIVADAMLLLKRPLGEGPYQVLSRFEFQHLPVEVKQGALF